jgi:hypothetical protein
MYLGPILSTKKEKDGPRNQRFYQAEMYNR